MRHLGDRRLRGVARRAFLSNLEMWVDLQSCMTEAALGSCRGSGVGGLGGGSGKEKNIIS